MNEMIEWDSSLIKASVYHTEKRELWLKFKNGTSYVYEDVSYEEYNDFFMAESKGSHFAKHIKVKKYTKLETDANSDKQN